VRTQKFHAPKEYNFEPVRLCIFDLDGTLYDQKKVRLCIGYYLFLRLILFSIRITDLKIISSFRQQREKHKGYSSPFLEKEQFHWCSEELGIPVEKVENTIQYLMQKLPLRFLLRARYKGIDSVFDWLRSNRIAIVIYSDYPVEEKLNILQLKADAVFCSTDAEIHQFKPSGKAIEVICHKMKIRKEAALLVGDREDTDGETARLAGIQFLHVDVQQARRGLFYTNLLRTLKKKND
jgi:putative hydrolase of the HAD superfamily